MCPLVDSGQDQPPLKKNNHHSGQNNLQVYYKIIGNTCVILNFHSHHYPKPGHISDSGRGCALAFDYLNMIMSWHTSVQIMEAPLCTVLFAMPN